ncbi:MAG: hypothetical protein KDL10_10260, partial [Kiritimatiellae bacterium]|nr:hypothetical protein [Kiritimatiellia bacterium]
MIVWTEGDVPRIFGPADPLWTPPETGRFIIVFHTQKWGDAQWCVPLLARLVQNDAWTIWFHRKHGRSVTEEDDKRIRTENPWLSKVLVEGVEPMFAQYSIGAAARSADSPLVISVRNLVGQALSNSSRQNFGEAVKALDDAASTKNREIETDSALVLLERLLPMFVDDPTGH